MARYLEHAACAAYAFVFTIQPQGAAFSGAQMTFLFQ